MLLYLCASAVKIQYLGCFHYAPAPKRESAKSPSGNSGSSPRISSAASSPMSGPNLKPCPEKPPTGLHCHSLGTCL